MVTVIIERSILASNTLAANLMVFEALLIWGGGLRTVTLGTVQVLGAIEHSILAPELCSYSWYLLLGVQL